MQSLKPDPFRSAAPIEGTRSRCQKQSVLWNGKGLACKISMRHSVGGLRKAARWTIDNIYLRSEGIHYLWTSVKILTVLVHGRPGSNNLMKSVRLRLNLGAVTGYTAILHAGTRILSYQELYLAL